jgi:hypothetical protein
MIQIDEALLAQATKLARENGCDVSRLIEDTLRDRLAARPVTGQPPFARLITVGGQGLRPGVDIDNSAALLGLMEQGA